MDAIAADDSSRLGTIGETLSGSVLSTDVGELVRSATDLGGVNGGLKVFVGDFTAIGGHEEVEFGVSSYC